MGDEIQLISDGDGLAVIGSPAAVERFLATEGLTGKSFGSPRLGSALKTGAAVAHAGAGIAASSGRWVKLTKESAAAVKKHGLIDSGTSGVTWAMVGKPGKVKQWLQLEKTSRSLATNPALLAGVAGVMAQMAMQHQMEKITDYLATIDAKLDDVLRAQTNQVLARMDGVDLAISEAMSVRETVGRVSDVTWSKVQSSSATILETQGYALRQLADLTERIEQTTRLGDLAETIDEAEAEVQKWLAVLARCVRLHDAIAVLELDRVLDASPDELDRHRLGLKAARQERVERIAHSTERLLERMIVAADRANSKVLLHPARSPAVVEASNHVALGIQAFHGLLGIESGRQSSEAKRWVDAAAEHTDRVLEYGTETVEIVKQLGHETLGQARSVKARVSDRIAEQKLRQRADDGAGDD